MRHNKGDILISVLIFASIAVTITIGLVNWGASMLSAIRTVQAREQAFQIAEAGVDYYRWHLAQLPTDYSDSTTTPGPYYHNFYDKDGNLIGQYALTITPPPLGSTKVVIVSTATTTAYPKIARTIQAILAEPSLAQYAVVADDYMRFGSGTVINGPVTSNHGLHFDTGSVANNVISSALATDVDPDTGQTEWGVWTDTDPSYSKFTTPPTSSQGVFLAGRQYPVPATDFTGLLANLQTLYTSTLTSGACSHSNAASCWTSSGAQGYYLHLNSNNTYDMYKVNSVVGTNTSPTKISYGCVYNYQTGWGTWSINSLSSKIGTYSVPANGIIFVQDNLWVDGTVNGTRATIAAGIFGSGTQPSITVNNNLLYTHTDGTDVIGLIAQNNLNVGLLSADNLTIDAALVAENGRVGRFYYGSSCSVSDPNYPGSSGNRYYYDRSSITLNGMIATSIRYGFAYTDNTGYDVRNLNYDANLLYSPPPNFPLASTQYQMASWKQIQ